MTGRVALSGSSAVWSGARRVGTPAHDEEISFTVHLRGPDRPVVSRPLFRALHQTRGADHHASREHLRAVIDFAHQHGLTVLAASPAERVVKLRGAAADINRAFGVALAHYQHEKGAFRGHEGELSLPAELKGVVEAVSGLDTRPLCHPHLHVYAGPEARGTIGAPRAFFPAEVARAYAFPEGTGKGQSVAIIELGGAFDPAELASYWRGRKLSPGPTVKVGANSPRAPRSSGADGEVYLDICVIGALCPEATLVLYFADDFASGIKAAANDPDYHHSAMSISWGGAEDNYSKRSGGLNATGQADDSALKDATGLGIPVFISAGDNGSGNVRNGDGQTVLTRTASVCWPASSAYAIGCGGTQLTVDANGAIQREIVWNNLESFEGGSNYQPGKALSGGATGGGVSELIPAPDFQKAAGLRPKSLNPGSKAGMRGLPDVAGNADPYSGYKVAAGDGTLSDVGGTSAVAPLWAALTVLLNENLADLGLVLSNPAAFLYQHASLFHDITEGDNNSSPGVGGYPAGPGWDASTGLGSPNGAALLEALRQQAKPGAKG